MKYADAPMGKLTATEKARWLDALDNLLRFAGAPGDWGYGTKLGMTTEHLHKVRQDVRASEVSE